MLRELYDVKTHAKCPFLCFLSAFSFFFPFSPLRFCLQASGRFGGDELLKPAATCRSRGDCHVTPCVVAVREYFGAKFLFLNKGMTSFIRPTFALSPLVLPFLHHPCPLNTFSFNMVQTPSTQNLRTSRVVSRSPCTSQHPRGNYIFFK